MAFITEGNAPAQPASAPAPDKAKGGQLDSVQVRGKALNDDDQRRLNWLVYRMP